MKKLSLITLVMCVSYLTADYLLIETEDDDMVSLEDDIVSEEDRSSVWKSGQDFADPPPSPPPTPPSDDYDPSFWTRWIK